MAVIFWLTLRLPWWRSTGWPAVYKVSQHAFLISFTQRWRRSWCWGDSEFGHSWNVNWICPYALTENPCSFCFCKWMQVGANTAICCRMKTWVEVELAAEKNLPLNSHYAKIVKWVCVLHTKFSNGRHHSFNMLLFGYCTRCFAWYCICATWMQWYTVHCSSMYLTSVWYISAFQCLIKVLGVC